MTTKSIKLAQILFQEDFYEKVFGTEIFFEILNRDGFNLNLPIEITFVKDVGIFYEQFHFVLN